MSPPFSPVSFEIEIVSNYTGEALQNPTDSEFDGSSDEAANNTVAALNNLLEQNGLQDTTQIELVKVLKTCDVIVVVEEGGNLAEIAATMTDGGCPLIFPDGQYDECEFTEPEDSRRRLLPVGRRRLASSVKFRGKIGYTHTGKNANSMGESAKKAVDNDGKVSQTATVASSQTTSLSVSTLTKSEGDATQSTAETLLTDDEVPPSPTTTPGARASRACARRAGPPRRITDARALFRRKSLMRSTHRPRIAVCARVPVPRSRRRPSRRRRRRRRRRCTLRCRRRPRRHRPLRRRRRRPRRPRLRRTTTPTTTPTTATTTTAAATLV